MPRLVNKTAGQRTQSLLTSDQLNRLSTDAADLAIFGALIMGKPAAVSAAVAFYSEHPERSPVGLTEAAKVHKSLNFALAALSVKTDRRDEADRAIEEALSAPCPENDPQDAALLEASRVEAIFAYSPFADSDKAATRILRSISLHCSSRRAGQCL